MNLYTLRDNLKRTITNKELLLARTKHAIYNQTGEALVLNVTRDFLEINLDELKKILADVELCYKKESDESWVTNPDRMGGSSTPEDFEQYKWR
jgi:hypothetical protein